MRAGICFVALMTFSPVDVYRVGRKK